MVDQELPHDARRESEEVGSIVHLEGRRVHHPQIGFMNESRRLQRVIPGLILDMRAGRAA